MLDASIHPPSDAVGENAPNDSVVCRIARCLGNVFDVAEAIVHSFRFNEQQLALLDRLKGEFGDSYEEIILAVFREHCKAESAAPEATAR